MGLQAKLFWALALLGALLLGAWVASIAFKPELPLQLQHGTALQPPRPLPELELLTHTGQPLRREQLTARWTFMFFGFTNCPDVCPTALTMLADVKRRLQDLPAGERPHIAFVSVDPERDTPEVVAAYIANFDSDMLGITGQSRELASLAAAVGIAQAKAPMGDSYMVDHSAIVVLLDPQARQAAIFSPPHDAAALAEDYRRLVAYRAAQS